MHTTNYENTLITVAGDCKVTRGVPPTRAGTIAALSYEMLAEAPYGLTSDELLVAVEAARKGPIEADEFFARARACLRASPLVKTCGYGLHHDARGRVALVPMESADYARLLADPGVAKTPGMRSSRA